MEPHRVRGVSRAAYGNAYLLEVSAAISAFPKERFTQKDIAQISGIEKNLVGLAVGKLEKAGLIRRLAREGQEQPFLREPTVYWANAERHLAELRDDR